MKSDFNYKSSKLEGNSLPKEFKDFKNFHSGETILVCGCGSSLNELMNPELFLTIGVNDVGRLFQPNYLVVLNPRQEFRFGRFKFVEESQSQALFTHLDLGIKHPNIIPFNLGKFNGVDFNDPTVLPYTRNSPYVALSLAVHMGAKRIGLIGVDFTDNHFFAKTGRHNLTNDIRQIDREYTFLYKSCQRLGLEVFNLSSQSRLSAIPKISINDFAQLSKLSTFTKHTINNQNNINASLKIVSYSTTPVAGVPAILARCINSRTIHSARCVWAENSYDNGVIFDGDIQWNQSPGQAKTILEDADLIIVHNGKVAAQHQSIFTGKAIITMAHNYMWNVDQSFVKRGFPGVVVGQYQAALPEFKDWLIVPNPIPLWEEAYQPGQKDSTVTICFTPSGKHEKYPVNHHLYSHSKGYDTTMKVLKQLAARFPLRLEVINNKQISHAESLAMKRRSHIVIDECVTGSYHRNSLEGLAAGCLVVNGMGLLDNVLEISRYCTGSNTLIPFLYASLDNLEQILTSLIEKGSEALTKEGILNYQWIQQHWDFQEQWNKFWLPAVDKAMQQMAALK